MTPIRLGALGVITPEMPLIGSRSQLDALLLPAGAAAPARVRGEPLITDLPYVTVLAGYDLGAVPMSIVTATWCDSTRSWCEGAFPLGAKWFRVYVFTLVMLSDGAAAYPLVLGAKVLDADTARSYEKTAALMPRYARNLVTDMDDGFDGELGDTPHVFRPVQIPSRRDAFRRTARGRSPLHEPTAVDAAREAPGGFITRVERGENPLLDALLGPEPPLHAELLRREQPGTPIEPMRFECIALAWHRQIAPGWYIVTWHHPQKGRTELYLTNLTAEGVDAQRIAAFLDGAHADQNAKFVPDDLVRFVGKSLGRLQVRGAPEADIAIMLTAINSATLKTVVAEEPWYTGLELE
jgi:hypothetical protein